MPVGQVSILIINNHVSLQSRSMDVPLFDTLLWYSVVVQYESVLRGKLGSGKCTLGGTHRMFYVYFNVCIKINFPNAYRFETD